MVLVFEEPGRVCTFELEFQGGEQIISSQNRYQAAGHISAVLLTVKALSCNG